MSESIAKVIDGKAVAARVRADVARAVAELREKGVVPCLNVVLVGEDPASQVYVRMKGKACDEVGIRGVTHRLPVSTTEDELLTLLKNLNSDPDVDGILVQLPVPDHIDPDKVTDALDPARDVDGFHPVSLGMLMSDRPGMEPCTPAGCIRLIDETGTELKGLNAVVIGRSLIVGKPMAMLLLRRHATVTVCHSRTRNLADVVRAADVVVAAVGRPRMVKGDWIREGAVVIDVGVNRLDDGKLVGDVDYEAALTRASWITPVPGGVGPMTIAYLMRNTVIAACLRRGIDCPAGL